MAQYPVRVNVRAAQYPLLSRNFGRSIIDERSDQHNMGLPQFTGTESQHDLGIPQIIYLENVMPTSQGFKSICYKEKLLPCVVLNQGACELTKVVKGKYVQHSGQVTVANIHNQGYVFDAETKEVFRSLPNCEYEPVIFPECIKWENIIGITAINNRVLAYSNCEVFWGQIETGKEFDFCPGLSGLAGVAKPIHLKGEIVRIYPLDQGAILYSTENALFVEYNKNNMHMPIRFEPIPNVGGISDWRHVAWESNSDRHYAYTSNGLQEIYPTKSEFVFPSYSEFLEHNIIERYMGMDIGTSRTSYDRAAYNPEVGCSACNAYSAETQVEHIKACTPSTISCPQLQEFLCPDDKKFKLNYAGAEYLCISYGCSHCAYEYVLVYNHKLRRWGKLAYIHTDVIEYEDSIGLVMADATILKVHFDHVKAIKDCHDKDIVDCEGIAIFGRYQLTRNKVSTIQEIQLERVYPEAKLDASWLHAVDGANWLQDELPCLTVNTESYRKYHIRRTGLTHSLKLQGTFDLNTILLTFTNGGSR